MAVIYSGTIAHVLGNPFKNQNALEIIENGAILVDDDGLIQKVGPESEIHVPEAELVDFDDAWIIPGLIDGHIHFPQFYATAAYGPKLLDWLQTSIFPMESRLADEAFAAALAKDFTNNLAVCGTTTSMVFGSQFPGAMRALFSAAGELGLRMISGFTLMDRFGPDELMTHADKAYDQAIEIMDMIKDNGLLHYAVTPRFAISCSDQLMEVCRTLVAEHPQIYVQTHINENQQEIETTKQLHKHSDHYADIYHKAGLLTPRTVLAHNIHALDEEMQLFHDQGCRICHCPSSNNYLGSGLFPLQRHLDMNIPVFMGSDIGAGTHFSILGELGEAYKVQQLQHFTLGPDALLWLGTYAGAEALHLQDRVGNFKPGKEADLVVLAPMGDQYLKRRLEYAIDKDHALFALLNLVDTRHVAQTVVAGKAVYCNDSDES